MFHPQGSDGPLMKPTAKEVVGFHPASAEEHKSFRPTFHPQGSDGPTTIPMAKDIHSFRRTSK
jgi:hypothetical protein